MYSNRIHRSLTTWNKIANSFDKTRRKPWKQVIDFIMKLDKQHDVIDIGCGNGRHLIPAAKQCKRIIGLDISEELLNIVYKKIKAKQIKNIDLIQSDVVHIPFNDNSFDATLYIATLHNVKEHQNRINSLCEMRRILKKDGKALVSVWSRWQDRYRKNFFKKWFTQKGNQEFGDINIYWRQHGLNIPRFYHLYSKNEFIKDINDAGLKIIELFDVKIHSKKFPDNYFALCKSK